MNSTLNFSQAASKTPWYKPTKESKELLERLDRDLARWGAHVHVSPEGEQVCSMVEARFGDKLYRFVFRVHDVVEVVPIADSEIPLPSRDLWKLHLRVRNVLKNFSTSVFDNLAAQQQLSLVMMLGANSSPTTHCVWAASACGLGISVVTTISPAPAVLQVSGSLPDEVKQWMQSPPTESEVVNVH